MLPDATNELVVIETWDRLFRELDRLEIKNNIAISLPTSISLYWNNQLHS